MKAILYTLVTTFELDKTLRPLNENNAKKLQLRSILCCSTAPLAEEIVERKIDKKRHNGWSEITVLLKRWLGAACYIIVMHIWTKRLEEYRNP